MTKVFVEQPMASANYTTVKVSNNKIIDSDSVIDFALLKLSDTEDVKEEIAGKTKIYLYCKLCNCNIGRHSRSI